MRACKADPGVVGESMRVTTFSKRRPKVKLLKEAGKRDIVILCIFVPFHLDTILAWFRRSRQVHPWNESAFTMNGGCNCFRWLPGAFCVCNEFQQ